MSRSEEHETVSRALLNLGRIGSVEGPIRSGFIGFYKAQKLTNAGREIPEDVKYQLNRWREFCERFVTITRLENRADKLEKWLGQKSKNEQPIASRTETYVAICSLFSGKEERQEWIPKMRSLCEKTIDTMDRNAKPEHMQAALRLLEELQNLAEDKLINEKRISEKILSGRALLR